MLLFRLADLPRRVRRLPTPLPLDPTGMDDRAASHVVGWMLEPALLNPRGRRVRTQVAGVLALYANAVGQPRSEVEALAPRIEEVMGNYRLGRCIARTVEHCAYQFSAPPPVLAHEPAALRALCYRRAQEQYGGYVPRARRADFLAAIAAEVDAAPAQVESALWADRAGAALLQRADAAGVDQASTVQAAQVIAEYNAAAVATLVAASSWVTLQLAVHETSAVKDLYRHAKALHVGVDVTQGSARDVLHLTLYGPGSRALVRGRAVVGDGAAASAMRGDAGEMDAGSGSAADGHDAGTPRDDAAAGGGINVPAAGGAPVAAVVTRLLRRHPAAVLGGWARLLGPSSASEGPRLYHVPLEGETLAALHVVGDEVTDPADDVALYDSAVEESFARAFHAQERDGRAGLVRGWTVQREPRAVVVSGSVFLPDFIFRRGDVEVYGEVIGYYTEEYLARKKRKLAALHGRIALLLIVAQELAPLFSGIGFPLVTYRAGRQIGVADVVATLEQAFDPFSRRRERARGILVDLCAKEGPAISEEELCVATGCAGRSELLALWTDIASATEEYGAAAVVERPRAVAEAPVSYTVDLAGPPAERFLRRYLPGYGLIPSNTVAAAQAALRDLLQQTGGPVSLQEALERLRHAGLHDPDAALLERLGAVVARADLFGEAQASLAAE